MKKIGEKARTKKLRRVKKQEMQEKPTAKSNKRAEKKKIGEKARAKKLRRVKKQENTRKTHS